MLASLEKKKSDTQKDIDSVTAGKKTASTLFKNSSDANVMAQTLETTDKEIEAMKKLIDVQTIYIGSVVLKIFKEEKADLYKRLLQQFTVYEIQNSHQVASFWTQVL